MLRVENFSYRHAHADKAALEDISFTLKAGEALLLTGHSGSGKSTLLAALSGLIPHYYKGNSKGHIYLGQESPGRMSLKYWGQQVGFMMQNPEAQFVASSVEEEIFLSLQCRGIKENLAAEIVEKQLKKFGIEHIRGQSVFQLSEGQKQKVVLACISALQPRLLLLDEPTANLDSKSVDDLAAVLMDLKKEGQAMIIADHRLGWLRDWVDRVLILENAKAVALGDWSILEDDEFRAKHHLRSLVVENNFNSSSVLSPKLSADAIKIKNLTFAYNDGKNIFSDFNAELPLGKVSVLTGPSGQGKTTLAKILCGMERASSGSLDFGDADGNRAYAHVVLQNTDHQLYMSTVAEELDLGFRINKEPIAQQSTSDLLAEFGLSSLAERHPQSLSGGEKQRLTVAVALTACCRLLILDEPTSGLDGYNLKLMSAQIKKIAERGLAVLVITHDYELAQLCADVHIRLPEAINC